MFLNFKKMFMNNYFQIKKYLRILKWKTKGNKK